MDLQVTIARPGVSAACDVLVGLPRVYAARSFPASTPDAQLLPSEGRKGEWIFVESFEGGHMLSLASHDALVGWGEKFYYRHLTDNL